MFFTLILENENGDRVDMTTTANQYMVSQIEDLNPPTGTISISYIAIQAVCPHTFHSES